MSDTQFIHGMRQLRDFKSRCSGACALTIGSFDGVHLGHQALLKALIAQAKQLGLPSVVMVFEPLPHEYFSGEKTPARLSSLREKVEKLFSHGVDTVVCLKFNSSLRELSAAAFVQNILVDALGIKYLVVGDDFRFGCDRKGDFAMLQSAGEQFGFHVTDTNTQSDAGERISSTRIRGLLEQSQFAEAELLLGCEYAISGRVIYGKQLGRQIGFRTVNLSLGRRKAPVNGVFAVVITVGGQEYQGVANVGVRPTVSGGSKPLLESHIFNFDRDIYGERISVAFKCKIRDEMRFASLDALKEQIVADVKQAKQYFLP